MIITRRLNELKIPSFKGTPWQQPNVGNILRNEAVIGTYQPTHRIGGKTAPNGQPIKDYLPAAVPEELFWRVQRNKKQRPSKGRKGEKFSNLFSGKCFCQQCAGPIRMRSGQNKGVEWRYLHCDNKYRKVGCDCKGGNFRYDLFEAAILDHVNEFEFDLGDGRSTATKEAVLERLKDREEALAGLERRHRNLIRTVEMTDDEGIARDLLGQMSERRSEIHQAKAEISELKGELATIESRENDVATVTERIQLERLSWTTGTAEKVYESRSRVARTLAQYIDFIFFDYNVRRVQVQLGGGLILYEFDKTGKMLTKKDNRGFVGNAAGAVLWKDRDEMGRRIENTGQLISGHGWTLDDLASDIPNDDVHEHQRDRRKTIARKLLSNETTS